MLNVITILTDNEQGITEPRVKMVASVPPEADDTAVSMVEWCLAGADCEAGETGAEVSVAKQQYTVEDMMVFKFHSYSETNVLVENFTEFLIENKDVDPDEVVNAAKFMDMLSELIVDAEDEGRCVRLVSTLLEPVKGEQ